jgi:hypothetical protein
MLPFLFYEGKVAVALAVFYLFYRLLLRKETFHRLNRIVLVGLVITSFLLPWCIITIHKPIDASALAKDAAPVEGVASIVENSAAWWPLVLTILFWIGVVIVLGRVLVSILSIAKIIRRGEVVRAGDCSPVIIHEKAHIGFRHSAELLAVDILSAFQWFNPAIWMMRSDLQELHEYEADDAVLRSGADIRDYQYLLIRKAACKSGFSVANRLNHSALKNRIKMMSKNRSPLARRLRVLGLVPLVCMCVSLQTQTVYDDLPAVQEYQVVLNLEADGLVYVNGTGGYGFEIERMGRYLRGAMGNRVYPPLAIQILASPEAPAGASDQLMRELRNFGLLETTMP